MKNILIILLATFSQICYAQTLTQSSFSAGKSVALKMVNSLNEDITSQYSINYSGNEIKIAAFKGKPVLIGSTVGNYNLVATKVSDSSQVILPVSVSSGTLSKIVILGGNSQSAKAGSTLPDIRVKLTDSFNNPVTNVPVVFSVSSGSATVSLTSAFSDVSGIASTSVTLGSVGERNLINATSIIAGLSKSVYFTATSTPEANQASKVVFSFTPSQVNIGGLVSTSVKIVDSGNYIASNFAGLISIKGYKNSACTVPSTMGLSGTLSANAASGVFTFFSISPQSVETLYLKASGANLSGSCSQAILVLPATTGLSALKIIQLPTLLKSNKSFFPAVKVLELDNNRLVMSSVADLIQIKAYSNPDCSQSSLPLTGSSKVALGGIATFPSLKSSTEQIIYLRAELGSLFSQCSAALTVLPNPEPLRCEAGQHAESNSFCVSNIKDCGVVNGIGIQTWPGSTCVASSCVNGFHIDGNVCVNNIGSTFYYPQGLAVDSVGNVFAVDTYNSTVRKITPSGVVTTFAGVAGSVGDNDGIGSSARFNNPYGIAIDSSDIIYVADTRNQRIRKISPTGTVTTIAGSGAEGSANGVGANASFHYPRQIAVDRFGSLYVADTSNSLIRKITSSGIVTTYAGKISTDGVNGISGSDDGMAAMASFSNPEGIAVDSEGTVYVSDSGNQKIRKIDTNGVVSTFAGSGSMGSADGIGSASSFWNPEQIAVDGSGNLYVADSINHKIRKITKDGIVSTIAGTGIAGSSDGIGLAASFAWPNCVALDKLGNLYIADTGNQTLRVMTTDYLVSTFAGLYGIIGSSDGIQNEKLDTILGLIR